MLIIDAFLGACGVRKWRAKPVPHNVNLHVMSCNRSPRFNPRGYDEVKDLHIVRKESSDLSSSRYTRHIAWSVCTEAEKCSEPQVTTG